MPRLLQEDFRTSSDSVTVINYEYFQCISSLFLPNSRTLPLQSPSFRFKRASRKRLPLPAALCACRPIAQLLTQIRNSFYTRRLIGYNFREK